MKYLFSECDKNPGIGIGVGATGMEACPGGHSEGIPHFKGMAVEFCADLKRGRGEIAYQHPQWHPVLPGKICGQLKSIPAHIAVFGYGVFAMDGTKPGQADIFPGDYCFTCGINQGKSIM